MAVIPSVDPYTLDNFRQAYHNLIDGTSPFSSVFTRSDDFAMEATHYHVKLTPHTSQMVMDLYEIEGVAINPYPFHMMEVPQQESANWPVTESRSISDEGRYYHIPEEPISVDGGLNPEDMEPYMLPILYAVWPVDLEFPSQCDYEIQYEVFLPETDGEVATRDGSNDLVTILEQEALRIACGPQTRSSNTVVPSGWIYAADQEVSSGRVPIRDLYVRVKVGSKHTNVRTNNAGYFYSGTSVTPFNAEVHVIMHGIGEFRITNNTGSVHSYRITVQSSGTWLESETTMNWNLLTIFRAANFFHNGTHPISKNCLGRQIKYHHKEGTNNFITRPGEAYINIYDNGFYGLKMFGTVCHELGHNSMAAKKGRLTHANAEGKHKESWASFVGWYLTDMEYSRLGYRATKIERYPEWYLINRPYRGICSSCDAKISHGHSTMFCVFTRRDFTQARQDWQLRNDDYTPFYVDLVDDSNQRRVEWIYNAPYVNTNLPNDNIKNFPVSILQDLAMSYQNLSTVSDQIKRRYMGIYFTQTQWDQFVETYNMFYNWRQ